MSRIQAELNRQRIVEHIAAGCTPSETAAALGLSPRTVYRALQHPAARAALAELHTARLNALLDVAAELAPHALVALKSTLESPIVNPSAKVAAARAALGALANLIGLADTDQRLRTLEALAPPSLPEPPP